LITYKDGKPDKWGYSVKLSEYSFKWIKILLEPELESKSMVKPVRDSQDLLEELGKTANTVVADYLRFLWKYTVDDIRKYQGPDFETTYNISIILTVPAMWSPAAKDKTLRAAEAAGLPPNITLVTEPEAAALSTLKDKEGVSDLKVGIFVHG
jgi:molecular chaperone DnaK (HSP70)